MQDSYRSKPIDNAADFRHEPESDQLLPDNYKSGEIETEGAGVLTLEVFSSSAGTLNSIKIGGVHHGVKHLGSGYYEVAMGEENYLYVIYKDEKLTYAPEDYYIALRRRSIELSEIMLRARKQVEA